MLKQRVTVAYKKPYQQFQPGDTEEVGRTRANWLTMHGFATITADKPKVRQAIIAPETMETRDE